MHTYILQKDLPDCKAGTEFHAEYGDTGYYPLDKNVQGYSKTKIENNPEWFKKKEEPKFVPDTHPKAVVNLAGTENEQAKRHINLAAVRSLYTLMTFMGFNYLTKDDLVNFVLQKPISPMQIDVLSAIKAVKLYVVKNQHWEIAAALRELEKTLESCNKGK